MTQRPWLALFCCLTLSSHSLLSACAQDDGAGGPSDVTSADAVGEEVPVDEDVSTSTPSDEGVSDETIDESVDDALPEDDVGDDESSGEADDSEDAGGTDEPVDEVIVEVDTFLLHVRSSDDALVKIDTETGEERIVCSFTNGANYPSITFGIDGNLYGSRSGQFLDLIDPCTCETTYIGDIGYTAVAGITANGVKSMQLYGISGNSDVLLDIALEDANAIEVGDGLGLDFGYLGSTWSDDIQELFSINADTDELYQVDIDTGLAHSIAPLDVNFGSVGIEWHPGDGVLYACTDNHLYAVDTTNGTTTEIGAMGHGCNNLAAQWTPNECIDSI